MPNVPTHNTELIPKQLDAREPAHANISQLVHLLLIIRSDRLSSYCCCNIRLRESERNVKVARKVDVPRIRVPFSMESEHFRADFKERLVWREKVNACFRRRDELRETCLQEKD